MTKVLVSSCLLGVNCKYNGGNNYNSAVVRFLKDKDVIPLCPELSAGLGCPRKPIEIVDGILKDKEGNSFDAPIRKTVTKILNSLDLEEIECAVLQSRSPTCGVNQVYDGSFSGKLISGSGVFATMLMERGVRVIDAEDIE